MLTNQLSTQVSTQFSSDFASIEVVDLAQVSGGQGPAPATNPPPANPGINEPTYRYAGGEIGKIGGELLGSPTATKHLETAGQAVGTGLYRAGEWLGNTAGRWLYGN